MFTFLMRSSSRRRAFTLTELLVVLACLAIFAAILLPCLVTAREAGRAAACLAHVRSLGQALALYAEDWDGCLPVYAERLDGTGAWWEVLPAYAHSADLFRCPALAAAASWGIDYGVNYSHVVQYPPGFSWVTEGTAGPARLDQFARPAETLALADGFCGALYDPINATWQPAPDWGFAPRHRGGVNCLFVDGHARWLGLSALLGADQQPGREIWGHYARR